MKKLGTIIIGLLTGANIFAQTCTVNPDATTVGAYPSVLEIGTVGVAYEQDVTIIFPTDSLGYPVVAATINNVSLPAGLSWECSTPDCFYTPNTNAAGCFRISGTPTDMGIFPIVINATLDLSVLPGLPNQYQTSLEITGAATGLSNEGFNSSTGIGCAPLSVSFLNNNPGMDGYQWNFGNGHSHWGENPENVVFEEPGEYVVSYTAYGNADTTYTYVLNSINLTSVEQSLWYTAVFDMNPKFYVTIYEAGVASHIYQSSTPSSAPTGQAPKTFNNINLTLDPTKSYTVEIYEYDALNADDDCGSHYITFPFENGTSVNPAMSTISWNITATAHMPTADMHVTDTIHVHGAVTVPDVDYSNGELIATSSDDVTFQWYLNGTAINDATTLSYTPTLSGYYTVVVANAGGCSETSIEVLATSCLPDYSPEIVFVTTGGLELENALADHTIDWYFNGSIVTGANTTVMPVTATGAYSVTLTDAFGCTYTSAAYNASLSATELAFGSVTAFPNPTTGKLTINTEAVITAVDVLDASGRIVQTTAANATTTSVDLTTLPNGYYMVKIQTVQGVITKNVVKH